MNDENQIYKYLLKRIWTFIRFKTDIEQYKKIILSLKIDVDFITKYTNLLISIQSQLKNINADITNLKNNIEFNTLLKQSKRHIYNLIYELIREK